MNEELWAIIGATILSPVLAAIGSRLIEKGKATAAYLELKNDDLYQVGAAILSIRRGSTILIGTCKIHSIAVGRIEVRGIGDNEGVAMSWSCREFIALDPVVSLEP